MGKFALYKTKVCPCGKPYHCKGLCKNCYVRKSYLDNPAMYERRKAVIKKYHKAHRARYNELQRIKAKKTRDAFREEIKTLKSQPCLDCHNIFPDYIMEFDHTRGKKIFNVSTSTACRSKRMLQEELAKCDVICANCHRQRTFDRKQLFPNQRIGV